MTTKNIPLDKLIVSPFQARQSIDFEGTISLAISINSLGLLQPLIGREVDGEVQIAFGHRRLAALRLLADLQAGAPMAEAPDADSDARLIALAQALKDSQQDYGSIPVKIAQMSDLEFYEAGTAENLQRRDLNDIEKAQALKVYMTTFDKTSADAGALFGLSGTAVRNYLRLLGLPADIQEHISEGKISQASARKLLQIQSLTDQKTLETTASMIAAGDVRAADVDYVIQQAVKKSPNTQVMWESWQRGEPRGGRGLWPLDGYTSDLPQPLKASWFMKRFKGVTAALERALGKDRVPSWLEAQIANCAGGLPLSDAAGQLGSTIDADHLQDALNAQEMIYTLIHPPVCTRCPFYTVIAGQHVCGLSPCWENKRTEYLKTELARVQAKIDVPLYDVDRDGVHYERAERTTYARLENGEWGQVETRYADWVAERVDHLRIIEHDPQYLPFPFTDSVIYGLVSVRSEISERIKAMKNLKSETEGEIENIENEYVERRAQSADNQHNSMLFIIHEVSPRIARLLEPVKTDLFAFISHVILPEYMVILPEYMLEQLLEQDNEADYFKQAFIATPLLFALEDAGFAGPKAVVAELRSLADDFEFISTLDLDELDQIAENFSGSLDSGGQDE